MIETIISDLFKVLTPDSALSPDLCKKAGEILQKSLLFSPQKNSIDIFSSEIKPGKPLSLWFGELSPEKLRSERVFTTLKALAGLLDSHAGTHDEFIAFMPDWFFIGADEKIIACRPLLEIAMANRQASRLSELQRSHCRHFMHPKLASEFSAVNKSFAIVYSFTLFLIKIFFQVQGGSIAEVCAGLVAIRQTNSDIPPGLPEKCDEIISQAHTKPSSVTCGGVVDIIREAFMSSPQRLANGVNKDTSHSLFGYSVTGFNKSKNSNEDRFFHASIQNVSFFAVADGVSTADLGTGAIAADEIARLFSTEFQQKFKTMAADIQTALDRDPRYDWLPIADKYLQIFFLAAQSRIAALLNSMVKDDNAIVCEYPMCSTLTAAVAAHDQAVLRSVGDSPALLFSPSRDAFWKLTSDHHATALDLSILDESSRALTRVIGSSGTADDGLFMVSDDAGAPLSIQLRPGDILMLASDGAIECIAGTSHQQKLGTFEKELRGMDAAGDDLKKMVRKLISLGESGLSNDNITINALLVVADLSAKERKNG